MKWKKTFLYVIITIFNSFLLFTFSDYFSWFLTILALGAMLCLVVIVSDIVEKRQRWKIVLKFLSLGVASYLLGILCFIIRDYFMGYLI